MLWGMASNHTMSSLTCKHVSFDPLLQIIMASQCTLLVVTYDRGMVSSCPFDEGSIISNEWFYIKPQVKIYHHNLLPLFRRILWP